MPITQVRHPAPNRVRCQVPGCPRGAFYLLKRNFLSHLIRFHTTAEAEKYHKAYVPDKLLKVAYNYHTTMMDYDNPDTTVLREKDLPMPDSRPRIE